ncbi:hypothetical protein BC833DRAFT_622308 [Globomyces pollinis-pini]|nr:hypothetical protein BC833DRAFT_622308 [Globomyces pollinis-pini]
MNILQFLAVLVAAHGSVDDGNPNSAFVPGTNIPCTPSLCGNTGGNTENQNECDPFSQVCPEASCDHSFSQPGLAMIASPNNTADFYLNEPINVTYSFSSLSNPFYHRYTMSFYYRESDTPSKPWNFWFNATRGSLTSSATISNTTPGRYDLIALADGIDPTTRSGVGPKVSCTDYGWPYFSLAQFKLLANSVSYPNKNSLPMPLNQSEANSISMIWSSILSIIFMQIF